MTAGPLTAEACAAWVDELHARRDELDRARGWTPLGQRDGLVVELLRQDGADCVRGEVLLGTELETAAQRLVLDRDAMLAWDPTADRCVEHGRLGDHALLQMPVLTGAHPLVQNREFLFHEAVERVPGGIAALGASRDVPGIAPLPGCRRATLAFSMRCLQEVPEGVRCRATWQVDLGGWMPKGLVTSGQVSAMLREHATFRSWWPTG